MHSVENPYTGHGIVVRLTQLSYKMACATLMKTLRSHTGVKATNHFPETLGASLLLCQIA